MSTKKPAKTCKIKSGRKPTRKQYEVARYNSGWTIEDLDVLFQKRRAKSVKSLVGDESLPLPHEWPNYGGLCWEQAYEEMQALTVLSNAWKLWLAVNSGSYHPPQEVMDAYYLALVTAKQQYQIAWDAMETCLTITV